MVIISTLIGVNHSNIALLDRGVVSSQSTITLPPNYTTDAGVCSRPLPGFDWLTHLSWSRSRFSSQSTIVAFSPPAGAGTNDLVAKRKKDCCILLPYVHRRRRRKGGLKTFNSLRGWKKTPKPWHYFFLFFFVTELRKRMDLEQRWRHVIEKESVIHYSCNVRHECWQRRP